MAKLSDNIFQGKGITVEDANKIEILSSLTEMNDLFKEIDDLHRQMIEKLRQAQGKVNELNYSGYFDLNAMKEFLYQFYEYKDKIFAIGTSPFHLLTDKDLVDDF